MEYLILIPSGLAALIVAYQLIEYRGIGASRRLQTKSHSPASRWGCRRSAVGA
jgi:hypothetical protein